ncbi:MAG: hypothetical protein MPN21_27605 [Thermoanaerobaculia bacterium]|nr:hypothetical protein [Thermoanaerobaculia bacterium]
MRNVTVSLNDDIYRRARVEAAERDLSLSAFVRVLLEDAMRSDADFRRRKRLQDETLASITSFDAGSRLSRDDVHRR